MKIKILNWKKEVKCKCCNWKTKRLYCLAGWERNDWICGNCFLNELTDSEAEYEVIPKKNMKLKNII